MVTVRRRLEILDQVQATTQAVVAGTDGKFKLAAESEEVPQLVSDLLSLLVAFLKNAQLAGGEDPTSFLFDEYRNTLLEAAVGEGAEEFLKDLPPDA